MLVYNDLTEEENNMNILTWVARKIPEYRRRQQAHELGCKVWAPLWRLSDEDADSSEAELRIRNAIRLYLLTRGRDNPWKSYKGY